MPSALIAAAANARFKALRIPRRYPPDSVNVAAPQEYLFTFKHDLIPIFDELLALYARDGVDRVVRVKNTTGGTLTKGTLLKVIAGKLTPQTSASASNNPAAGDGVVINVAATFEVGQVLEVTDGVLYDYPLATAISGGVSVTADHLEKGFTTPTVTALPAYEVSKADADDQTGAAWVLDADLADGAYGWAFAAAEVTGIDTSGATTVEDLVYLSATAGQWGYTAPGGADQVVQVVGVVKKKDATTGKILFFPGARRIEKIGSSFLQASSVVAAAIASGAVTNLKTTEAARSPAQITSNQDNYNPGGAEYLQRWNTDASRNVTGLTFSTAQVDGQRHLIVNVGAQDIVLKEQTTSTAANQFLNSTGADITLSAKQAADVIYDATTARWRVFKRN